MCGIWAIFGSDADVSDLINCSLKIKHRGPDAFRFENINHFRNCCFGFHHLAIQDDVFGMQPLRVHRFPHLWLVYNGEIYNCNLLAKEFGFEYETHSDGESMLHLYDKGGAEFMAKHLDGVFGFCLLDTKERKVVIGRDTFGVKPCFRFTTKDGLLAVCSEVKGLMDVPTKLDTANNIVHTLTPGHIETYDITESGTAVFTSLTQFSKVGETPLYKTLVPDKDLIENDIHSNIRTLFEAAVEKRLMSMRRIGCLLSGGLDSSLVASIIARQWKQHGMQYPLQTFSVGMPGSSDIKAARKVADHIRSEHHEILISYEDGLQAIRDVIYHTELYDTITIRSSVGMYLMAKYISENTDTVVLFSGEGADEVAQGYRYFRDAPTAEEGSEDSIRLLEEIHYFDVVRVDRATSAFGLEVRVPFLDHQFTSYYLSTPAEMRSPIGKDINKRLLRESFDGLGLIPEEILWRPKEGFSDGLAADAKPWYVILKEHVENLVTDEELAAAAETFPLNSPTTKEMYYFRKTFEEFFPGNGHLTPHCWMPKWTVTTDLTQKGGNYIHV